MNPKISSWSLLDTNMSLKTTIYSCCPDEPYQSLKIEYKMLRSLAKTSTIIAQAIGMEPFYVFFFFLRKELIQICVC